MICLENNYYDEDFASFATHRFSTLSMLSDHLEDLGSHKNTKYEKVCVNYYLYLYILADISAYHLELKYMATIFFHAIPT